MLNWWRSRKMRWALKRWSVFMASQRYLRLRREAHQAEVSRCVCGYDGLRLPRGHHFFCAAWVPPEEFARQYQNEVVTDDSGG